ncbi:ABC transporter ATP-binding protein [Cellulomonas sp. NPDC057328]|uniref:ABC transporter ATP-binding protein n=1 Tax=Cellulomonas sp. NPDC057328 TaxID=3346101 RepID=UPI00362E9364
MSTTITRRPEVLLEVKDLSVGYRTEDGELVTLVDQVSLTVHENEVLCVVGESGSGKSVTMSAVLGLLPPGLEVLGGSIEYRGNPLLGLSEREMRRLRGAELGVVFQDPLTALNPVKRVGRQLERAIRAHNRTMSARDVRRRVLELLEDVRIPNPAEMARAYPHQWSGGMRQRAAIAGAIANRPRVLVADEPTTALDVTVQAQVMDLLTRVRAESGAALVLITHDLGLVAEVADRICIMYAGRVVEEASVWDVFDAPAHPYTAGLLGSLLTTTHAEGRAYSIPGSPPTPTRRPPGCAFAARCELPARSTACTVLVPELRPAPHGGAAACHHLAEARTFTEAVAH